jgi:Sugar-specific transcriptional regulator TrmB.
VLAIRFMSPAVASMLRLLIGLGGALARDLAEEAGIESKHVYPYLKYWVRKGIVAVRKESGVNVYSINDKVKAFLSEALQRFVGKKSREKIIEKAAQRYRERFGREMPPEYIAILSIFIEQALSKSSPYIAIRPGEETMPQVLRTMILSRHGKDLDIEEIIEALKELEMAKLIFIDRRHYKARLDRSLL